MRPSRARRSMSSTAERTRFGLELLVGRTLLAQRLENQAAELPPRRGELVGDLDRREPETPREIRVGRALAVVAGQVVALEQGEALDASARGAVVAQP